MRRAHGQARIDDENPEQVALCDRCARLWNRGDLDWQWEWTGTRLLNRRVLVCRDCKDEPAGFLRSITIPPDPPPVFNVRPERNMSIDGASQWTLSAPLGLRVFTAKSTMTGTLQKN